MVCTFQWGSSIANQSINQTHTNTTASSNVYPINTETSKQLGFNKQNDWLSSIRSVYRPGLITVKSPKVPQAYEISSILPQYAHNGVPELLVSSHSGTVTSGSTWTKTVSFSSQALQINGVNYTIPKEYWNMQLLVLPISQGIVWSPTTSQTISGQSLHQALKGNTTIYYTPYHLSESSLAKGARVIAQPPHQWRGFDGPVTASAWAGWLP